jgi:hypothetical protein
MPDDKIAMDSNDYIELLLRHLVRSKPVFDKAVALKLTGDDLILDETFGVQLYKELADTIFEIGFCPIDQNLLFAHVNRKIEDCIIPDTQFDITCELLDFIYDGQCSPLYFLNTLKDFVKSRRSSRIAHEHKDNPDLMYQNMQSLMVDLHTDEFAAAAVKIHPFAAPVFKTHQELMGVGLQELDERMHGLGLGEYGIIVGFSGGGKTVLGCNIVSNNASVGFPSQFISLEADEVEISQRFYSKFFEIPYSELHKGGANIQLEEAFKDPALESRRQNLARNLSLIGLKGQTPITADQVYQVMVNNYETTGFAPMVVVLDQLQFVEPRAIQKGMKDWEIEKRVSAELDELSHKTIGGQKFCLWVLHQAKGKLKRCFSRDDIDGFKGVIHKPDLVMGIGRDSEKTNECDIFSLKVRHCPDFNITYNTDFQYMRFGAFKPKDGERASSWSRPTSNPMADSGPPQPPSFDSPPQPPEVANE